MHICWYFVWMRLGKGWHYKCGWMLPPTLALFCPIPAAWELYVSRHGFYDKKRHLCNHQVFVWATLLIIKSQNEIICIPMRVHTSYCIAYLLHLRTVYVFSGIIQTTEAPENRKNDFAIYDINIELQNSEVTLHLHFSAFHARDLWSRVVCCISWLTKYNNEKLL